MHVLRRTGQASQSQTLAELISKGWSFQLKGRGLTEVVQRVLIPFIEEGASFSPSAIECRMKGEKIVWLGSLTRIDKASGEKSDSAFAHIWTVRQGKIARLQQYTYIPTTPGGRIQ